MAAFSANPAQFAVLLRTRARLLVQLIEVDPLQAGELSLPQKVLARARSIGPDLAAEQSGEWTGTLETAVADDPARGTSRSRWFLWSGGRRMQLHFGRRGSIGRYRCVVGADSMGVPGQTLSNTVCSVSSGSSFTGSGDQLLATLQMSFSSSVAGSHRITKEAGPLLAPIPEPCRWGPGASRRCL